MAKIIAVSNQKGGVGKTTTSNAVALILFSKGYKVLVIDLDPQGNLGFCFNADNVLNATAYEVLRGDAKVGYAIQHTQTVDVISSNILLSSIELEYTGKGREFLLQRAIKPIEYLYDYIIIDTPPALGILTVNAYATAQSVIVPMLSDIFSLYGITQLYDAIERVKSTVNPKLSIAGILLTKHNPNTLFSREVHGAAKLITNDLKIPLFKTFIRSSVVVSEAQSLQKNLLEYAPKNNATKDYVSFVDELIEMEV